MKAKLFIKGQKEPIELDDAEAKIANDLICSAKSNDTPFSIEGVWGGRKADMRYVVFPRKEKESLNKRETVAMTKQEAEAFEKEIEQDKKRAREVYGDFTILTRMGHEGEKIDNSIKWREFFYERNGAIRIEIKKTPEGRVYTTWFSRDSNGLWESLNARIESYWEYCRKQDFAEGKKLEQYDVMAGMEELKDNMNVTHETN